MDRPIAWTFVLLRQKHSRFARNGKTSLTACCHERVRCWLKVFILLSVIPAYEVHISFLNNQAPDFCRCR